VPGRKRSGMIVSTLRFVRPMAPSPMLRALALPFVLAALACDVDINVNDGKEETRPTRTMKMIAQPGNAGWSLLFTGLAEEPQSFRIKVGDGPFSDYRRGVMTLPADTPASKITVYYTLHGKEQGPLDFDFDPKSAALEFSKDALDMVRTGWISWRTMDDRTIVYFTALHMHTCALKKVEYGFDGKLDLQWALPPCRGPAGRLGDEPTWTRAPKGARSVSVRLTYVDGETTDIQRIPNDGLTR